MKTCQKCGSDNLSPRGVCRPCHAAYVRQRTAENPERSRAASRIWRANNLEKARAAEARSYRTHRDSRLAGVRRWKRENPEKVTASTRRWQAAHPELRVIVDQASKAVTKAIRAGTLIRPDACEACGRSDTRIEAAHHDYSRPLDVRWLCRPCHRAWDAAAPKTPDTVRESLRAVGTAAS